jgi:hypothetical protein
MRGNNPFDPYFAAGGEEIAGLDELLALYAHVRIVKCEIAVTVQNLDSSHGVSLLVLPNLASGSLSNSSGTPAMPYCRTVLVQHPTEKTLVHLMSTSVMAGRRKDSVLDDDWACMSGSAPAREWYWHVVLNGPIGHAALAIRYSVTLRYSCEWFGFNYLSQT